MKQSIIYIKGTACPYEDAKISLEQNEVTQDIEALQSRGHKVSVVGNSSKGFAESDLGSALQNNPEATTLIIHAHGNIKKKEALYSGSRESNRYPK